MDKFIKELEELEFTIKTKIHISYDHDSNENVLESFHTSITIQLTSFDKNHYIFKLLQNKNNFYYFVINYEDIHTFNLPLNITLLTVRLTNNYIVDRYYKLKEYTNLISICIVIYNTAHIEQIIESLIYLCKLKKLKCIHFYFNILTNKENIYKIIKSLIDYINKNDTNIFILKIDYFDFMSEYYCKIKTKLNTKKYNNRLIEELHKNTILSKDICEYIVRKFYSYC